MNIKCTYNVVLDEYNNELVLEGTLNTEDMTLRLTDNFKYYRPKKPQRENLTFSTRYNNKEFDCINGVLLDPEEVNEYIVMVHYHEIMGTIYNADTVDKLTTIHLNLLENWAELGLTEEQFDLLSLKIDIEEDRLMCGDM